MTETPAASVLVIRTMDDLEELCQREGKSWDAAQRLVKRLTDGVSIVEAAGLVGKLLVGNGKERAVTQTETSPMGGGLEEILKGIDARRSAIGGRLERLAKEKRDLKDEEKKLNQAATALRRITGSKNELFNCDICELPFASRQGLASHKTKTHKNGR